MKKSDFTKIIEEEVRKQVKEYVSVMLPIAVNEVVKMYLNEAVSKKTTSTVKATKRKPLTENVEEEWPTMGGSPYTTKRLTELMGFEPMGKVGGGIKEANIVSPAGTMTAMTDAGNPVEIPADKVPDYVKQAMTRDYSQLVKRFNK